MHRAIFMFPIVLFNVVYHYAQCHGILPERKRHELIFIKIFHQLIILRHSAWSLYMYKKPPFYARRQSAAGRGPLSENHVEHWVKQREFSLCHWQVSVL